jgi:hypothetical protein
VVKSGSAAAPLRQHIAWHVRRPALESLQFYHANPVAECAGPA